MKQIFRTLIISAAATACLTLAGCMGRIETGIIGLRTNFNGTLDSKIELDGIYTVIVGHMDQYTIKEVPIEFLDMKPKAKDNLSLADLDVVIYYRVKTPDMVRVLALKRQGASANTGQGLWLPAFHFVESVAKGEIADVISKTESLVIHTQRNALEADIKDALQKTLEASDPGAFEITRVIVKQVLTDPTIEASIRNVVNKDKELEAARKSVQIADQNAQAVAKTANTLTPQFLQHEYNMVLMEFAKHGGTVILDGSSSSKMINLKQ